MIVQHEKPDSPIFDFVTFNNASPIPVSQSRDLYDFQLVQIPIRPLIAEGEYFQLRLDSEGAWESVFQRALQKLRANVDIISHAADSILGPTFILNFCVAQQNPNGRMTARYSLANPVYFIERLNEELHAVVSRHDNIHIIDFDQIVGCFGRKYFQDDSTVHWNHGSYIGRGFTVGNEDKRLEPIGDRSSIYLANDQRYVETTYQAAISAFRTIGQIDSVRLVVFDLDDTLWRGVAAESDSFDGYLTEGWPLGIVEAASYLWKRGILLAIVSKNDEKTAERIWNTVYGSRFSLDNFFIKRINWRPKAENVSEIIQATNLLPTHVLFVDDNPVERAAVKTAIPGIRVLDAPLAHWRRALLWSGELQRAVITDEAMARSEMLKGQVQREAARLQLTHDDFLQSLGVKVRIFSVSRPTGRAFERCCELVNKTNQYNTTGKRWSQGDFDTFFSAGGILKYADVTDNYTPYGIVAVTLIFGQVIEQFVMSCRVFGLGVETTCLAECLSDMTPRGSVIARLNDTGKNHLCHSLYESMGFDRVGDYWRCEKVLEKFTVAPPHVDVKVEKSPLS